MVKLVCKRCNFRFNSEFPDKIVKCPYCGEKSIIIEPNAEELLNED